MNLITIQAAQLAQVFGWTLLHSLWQGALIAAILVLIYNLAKPKQSDHRYNIAVLAMLAMLACSIGTFAVLLEQSPSVTKVSLSDMNDENSALIARLLSEDGVEVIEMNFWEQLVETIEPFTPWLAWGWLLGFMVYSIKWLGGFLYVQNLRFRHSQPLSFEYQSQLNHLAKRMGLQQTLLMLESARINSPMVIGHFKPVVLVPLGLLSGMSPKQVEAILAHELAHILRHDFLVNLILTIIESIFFFHPAVWWIGEKIRQEREHCCDDMAISITENKKEYAETLAFVATKSLQSPKMAMTMNGQKQHLLTRIQRIFQPQVQKNNRLTGRAILGLLVLLGFTTLAWVSPETAKTLQPEAWAETFDAPRLLSDWMVPKAPETPRPASEVASLSPNELNNLEFGYTITRLDSPPPLPPLPDMSGMPLPPRVELPPMPPMPDFPDNLRLGEDMSEEDKARFKQYEKEMERWGEKYGKEWEAYGKQWGAWGEQFGEKWETEYAEKWKAWGEKFAEEMDDEMKIQMKDEFFDQLQEGLERLNIELERIQRDVEVDGNNFNFRFNIDDEDDDRRRGQNSKGYKYEYKYKDSQQGQRSYAEEELAEEAMRELTRQMAQQKRELAREQERASREINVLRQDMRQLRRLEDQIAEIEDVEDIDEAKRRELEQIADRLIRSLDGRGIDEDIIEIEGNVTKDKVMDIIRDVEKELADVVKEVEQDSRKIEDLQRELNREQRIMREEIIQVERERARERGQERREQAELKREIEMQARELEMQARRTEAQARRIEAQARRVEEQARAEESRARTEARRTATSLKSLKSEMVEDGYVRKNGRVKVVVNDGDITVNGKRLKGKDRDKYMRILRGMGFRPDQEKTVIEWM
ncbi:MAG: M56 family metallopeptidase [Bacteroidota bacterium]